MTTTTIRLVASDGTSLPLKVGRDAVGQPLVCTSWDLGFPDPREVAYDLSGQSGRGDTTTLHGGRTVTLDLDIKDGTVTGLGTKTRHQWMDIIRGMCRADRRPTLYVKADGWAQERQLELRSTPLTCTVDTSGWRKLETTLTFNAPKGVMESATILYGSIPSQGSGVGRSLPESYPRSYTPETGSNSVIITNDGTADVMGFYAIYGAGANPTLVNRTTGKVIRFQNLTIASGSYIAIDMLNRTVKLNSTQSVYGSMDLSVSSWWPLVPGANEIQFNASAANDACQCQYQVRSAWI